MLIAILNGKRLHAASCIRKEEYLCPDPTCGAPVILKRGTRRIAHFAHKAGSTCFYAFESSAHMRAKEDICEEYKKRGHEADIEVPVLSNVEDRRADILITSPIKNSVHYAIEVQDSNVGEKELWRRTRAYQAARVRPIWLLLLRTEFWKPKRADDGSTSVTKYPPRLHERWIERTAEEVWYYDPIRKEFWRATFGSHLLWHDGADFIDVSAGEHVQTDGYRYPSRRWVDVEATGPWPLSQIQISANGGRLIGTLMVKTGDN